MLPNDNFNQDLKNFLYIWLVCTGITMLVIGVMGVGLSAFMTWTRTH